MSDLSFFDWDINNQVIQKKRIIKLQHRKQYRKMTDIYGITILYVDLAFNANTTVATAIG